MARRLCALVHDSRGGAVGSNGGRLYAHGDVVTQTVFDRASDHYLLVIVGSENRRRVHGCLVHIDIIDDKIWIQTDGTERGMAPTLVRAGIAPERILLAFSSDGAYPYSDVLAA